MGIRRTDGASLPDRPDIQASLVQPDMHSFGESPTYLAYPNYRALLSYNCADKYAIAVGTLAEAIK